MSRSSIVLPFACLALALGNLTCAPVTPRSAPVRPTRPAPAVNWLSKNPRGELVLPRSVEIHLTELDGSKALSVELPSKEIRRVTRAGEGVIRGPVRVGGRTHYGDLKVANQPGGGLRATIILPLETYVAGVVAAELSIWSAAPAELEAMAIAARTFAVSAIAKRRQDGQPAVLTDGVMDQAYRGTYDGTGSKGAQAVAERLRAAVARTERMVVVRGDRLEETRYHASCGGHTANFADVFRSEVQRYDAHGPTGVPCAPCQKRAAVEASQRGAAEKRPLTWSMDLKSTALVEAGARLKLGGEIRSITPTQKDSAGRWLEVRVAGPSGAKNLRFDALRAALGYKKWKSGVVDALSPKSGGDPTAGATLRVQGRGRGHGVGLCQESARDYARAGWSAQQILSHYYPGTSVKRIALSAP
jgi:stage II sporulation protein D